MAIARRAEPVDLGVAAAGEEARRRRVRALLRRWLPDRHRRR